MFQKVFLTGKDERLGNGGADGKLPSNSPSLASHIDHGLGL
jgi:hypothetical protein